MKRYVIGDIHGRLEALKEVLKKANFNYEKDKLIILGDICDGGYNTYEVVEELLKIKNKVFIIGNHDTWFMDHIRTGWAEDIWLMQGGRNTVESYREHIPIEKAHKAFFDKGVYYYIEDNKLFVHGGFDPKYPIEKQTQHILTWDRDLINLIYVVEDLQLRNTNECL